MKKFYQTLNQAPRSMRHGKHRRTSPPAHGSPIVRASDSTGGTDEEFTIVSTTWYAPGSVTWVSAVDFAKPDPTPPAIPYAGIRTGELIGYRLWWILRSPKGTRLCSLAHRRLWEPGETIVGNVDQIVDYSGPI